MQSIHACTQTPLPEEPCALVLHAPQPIPPTLHALHAPDISDAQFPLPPHLSLIHPCTPVHAEHKPPCPPNPKHLQLVGLIEGGSQHVPFIHNHPQEVHLQPMQQCKKMTTKRSLMAAAMMEGATSARASIACNHEPVHVSLPPSRSLPPHCPSAHFKRWLVYAIHDCLPHQPSLCNRVESLHKPSPPSVATLCICITLHSTPYFLSPSLHRPRKEVPFTHSFPLSRPTTPCPPEVVGGLPPPQPPCDVRLPAWRCEAPTQLQAGQRL